VSDPLDTAIEQSIVAVSQGAAGTTSIVTGVAGKKVYVFGIYLSLDAAGTLKFSEVAGDLSGTINSGGAAAPPIAAFAQHPILWTSTAGEDLKVVTATGKAQGWIAYALV
jgi:hypothetical protein